MRTVLNGLCALWSIFFTMSTISVGTGIVWLIYGMFTPYPIGPFDLIMLPILVVAGMLLVTCFVFLIVAPWTLYWTDNILE